MYFLPESFIRYPPFSQSDTGKYSAVPRKLADATNWKGFEFVEFTVSDPIPIQLREAGSTSAPVSIAQRSVKQIGVRTSSHACRQA